VLIQQKIQKGILFFLSGISFVIFLLPANGEVIISQQVSGEAVYITDTHIYYIPDKSVNIIISFVNNSSENVLALGLQCFVPQGWQFQGTSTGNNAPAIYPQPGKVSDGSTPFEFAWINIPPFPFDFTFSVNIPSDFQGPTQINSQALYRYTGEQLTSNIAQTSFEGVGIPQEGEGQIEGEGEGGNDNMSCAEKIVKGCCSDNKKATQQIKNILVDLLFMLIVIGILGISIRSNPKE